MSVMILLLAWSTPADTNSSKAASICFLTGLIGISVVPLHGQTEVTDGIQIDECRDGDRRSNRW
jgi:hypothetical protein